MTSRAALCAFLSLFALLLLGAGVSAQASVSIPVAQIDASPSPLWDPSCYSTLPQLEAALQNSATQYPQIASLIDGGLAWEGTRHLWALKLGSNVQPSPKPTLFLLGGQHPRDIATTEVLLRFVTYLTQNYGVDPDVTWLLDNSTILILPEANPDGYYQVYANSFNQVKNRDNTACPNSANRGVNLNLNYPYQWNTTGTSSNSCDSTYPGTSPLSEPESTSILSLLTTNNTNIVLNLQAPGPAILYPWGYTATPPTDAAGLRALGWAMGRLNGTAYTDVRTLNSYNPISCNIDDTAYGQYGIPAFTLDIGTIVSPDCTQIGPLWNAQRPALLYAEKAVALLSSDTLSRSFGPSSNSIVATPVAPGSVQVTGVISSNYGTVAGAVYYIDTPGADGSGTPLSGSFGGSTANVSVTLDTTGLTAGRHLFLAQGKNSSNQWGVISSVFFTVTTPPTSTPSQTPTRTSTPTSTRTSTPLLLALPRPPLRRALLTLPYPQVSPPRL